MNIDFNKPFLSGEEKRYLNSPINSSSFSGDGPFTKKCESFIEKKHNIKNCILTNSCTSALEMSAHLGKINSGDEIIMPSYTFVSTANAFLLRGGKPVFVDIKKETINIDENLIEEAITKKTKCIVVVHYAGLSCNMEIVKKIAEKNNLMLVEDAAQAIGSKYKQSFLGSIGDLGTISFHQTKNIHCGEGGALLINKNKYLKRSKIIREKGTNRKDFIDGKINKYEWVDLGSSYLPSELQSAFLYSQLSNLEKVNKRRLKIWDSYHKGFESLEEQRLLTRPKVPQYNTNNGHMYFLILKNEWMRNEFIKKMSEYKIQCTTHYIPLHITNFGKKFHNKKSLLKNTEFVAKTIVRLPLWPGLEKYQDYIIEKVREVIIRLNS